MTLENDAIVFFCDVRALANVRIEKHFDMFTYIDSNIILIDTENEKSTESMFVVHGGKWRFVDGNEIFGGKRKENNMRYLNIIYA